MRIRSKLLVLMLSISLIPLAIAAWIGARAAHALGEELAAGARETANQAAERFLLQTVRDHSRLLKASTDLLRQSVGVLTRAAERRLGEPAPPATQPASISPATSSSARQAFITAAGVNTADVAEDIARLALLEPTFQLLWDSHPSGVFRLHVSLESGAGTLFPGDASAPAGDDLRRSRWYQNTRQRDAFTWTTPAMDASTQQPICTLSMPLRGPGGQFAGVAAADIFIRDIMREAALPAEWSREADTLVVAYDARVLPDDCLYVVARGGRGTPGDVIPAAEPTLLAPADAEMAETVSIQGVGHPVAVCPVDGDMLRLMLADLRGQRPAVRQAPFEDQAALWAYAPMPEVNAALLVIVPHAHILEPAHLAETTTRARLRAQQVLVVVLATGAVASIVVLSLIASRHLTRRISDLVSATHRIAAGDLDTPTVVSGRDELGELAATVNDMLPQLRERMRIKQSLSVAVEVQQSLLPHEAPQIEGLDIAGKSIYCDETGGDYYDFVDLSRVCPHTLGVAVGDVTGHGIAAALLMATARAFLRSHVDEPCSLGELLVRMNRHFCEDAPDGKFMTLRYLLLDAEKRTLHWTGAGHDPALVYSPRTDTFSELGGGGIPLGIEADWRYEGFGPRPIEAGEVIVVGTDGIWEARDPANQMFGKGRVHDLLREHCEENAADISRAITEATARFRGTRAQLDDITLVVIKVLPR